MRCLPLSKKTAYAQIFRNIIMNTDNIQNNENGIQSVAENSVYNGPAATDNSSGAATPHVPCWACGKTIDAHDAYCRHCGKGQGSRLPFAYTPFGLFIMFMCIGPFAIYFTARSPAMSRRTKIIFSTVMTVLFCWMCYSGFVRFMERMNEIQQILGTGAMPVF